MFNLAHEALAQAQPNLQHIADALPDMICTFDARGTFTYASKASKHLLGYLPEELIGKNLSDFICHQENTSDTTPLFPFNPTNGSSIFQKSFLHKNGQLVDICLTLNFNEQEGVAYGVAKECNEIKAQKEVQEKILQETSKILERIDECFIALDNNWNVTYWNTKFENLMGIPKDKTLGKNIWDCFPDAVGLKMYHKYHYAMETQQSVSFQDYYPPMNMWVEVHAYPSADGLSVLYRDITAKKLANEKLQLLSTIVQKARNLVILTSAQGDITWVNDAFLKTSGYTWNEVIGKRPKELLHGPDTDKKTALHMRNMIKEGKGFHAEIKNYTKTKQEYWVDIFCQPIFDDEGNLQHFVATEIDITEKKKLQIQLEEELNQRERMISAATIKAQEAERSQMSLELHDNINQVLTTVKLYNELCLNGIDNDEEILQKSIDLLQSSISEIRNLSKRLSAPSLGKLRLAETADEFIETITNTNKITITCDTGEIEGLDVDKEVHLGIYRIMQEHFTNILKHANANKVKVKFTIDKDSNLVLEIKDDGVGFDTASQQQGIGIKNMKTRVESLHGKLWISSKQGKGCKLKACFPIID